jgi:hypothetical protein
MLAIKYLMKKEIKEAKWGTPKKKKLKKIKKNNNFETEKKINFSTSGLIYTFDYVFISVLV